jgi:glycosyltransferase involved in cell wall biosynthesis/GT2 family glycosyltransferase
MSRPRILHLRASNFVGGPEHQLLRSAALEADGLFEMSIAAFEGGGEGTGLREAAESRGIPAISLPVSSRAALKALEAILRDRQIDVLCTHGYKADILGVRAGRRAGVPVACFLRGWTGENLKVKLYEAVDRFSLRFADRVVCLSNTQADKLTRNSDLGAKIRIVSNAIDVPPLDPDWHAHARSDLLQRFSLPGDSIIIATAGRLSPEKGVADFLEAAAQLRGLSPRLRFVVFGDGAMRAALQQQAQALGLAPQMTFAGFHADLRTLIPGFDLLVNPSHAEEMPNIVLEGMAAEVPVVATAVGGVEDMAGPGHAVRLVPSGNVSALAAAIGELLGDFARARALARAGRRRVEEAYSPAHQQAQLHALYRELLPAGDTRVPAAVSSSIAGVSAARQASEASVASEPESVQPFLSIVIPIRNEQAHIGDVLTALVAQEYPANRFEILVADGHSTDRTVEVVREFSKKTAVDVRCLENPAQLSSAGRNVGARQARGEFVFFIDGHCEIPSHTMLRDAVHLFDKYNADCLCRPQPLTSAGNTLFQDVLAHARATPLGHGRDSTIFSVDQEGPVNPMSAGALYRRSVFDRIGYYDESFDACEDVEFNYRVWKAGLTSIISPKITVLYRPRLGLRPLARQLMRYGRGRCRLVCKHDDAMTIGQIVPAALLAWLVVGGVSSIFWRPVAWLYAISLAPWVLAILFFSARLAWRYGWRHLFLAPPIYATIHLSLGAGLLSEWSKGKKARLPWQSGDSQGTQVKPDPDPALATGAPETGQKPNHFRADSAAPIPKRSYTE